MVEHQMIYSPKRKKQWLHNEYYESLLWGYPVINAYNLFTLLAADPPSSRSESVPLHFFSCFPISAGFQLNLFPRVGRAKPLIPLCLQTGSRELWIQATVHFFVGHNFTFFRAGVPNSAVRGRFLTLFGVNSSLCWEDGPQSIGNSFLPLFWACWNISLNMFEVYSCISFKQVSQSIWIRFLASLSLELIPCVQVPHYMRNGILNLFVPCFSLGLEHVPLSLFELDSSLILELVPHLFLGQELRCV